MNIMLTLAAASLAVWIYLLMFRGHFWLARERDGDDAVPERAHWPSVAVIVPARDEAETIARAIGSVLQQDYPGTFRIYLVDDQSSDGTAAIARALDTTGRLTVVSGATPPSGWTGKLWALKQGAAAAEAEQPDYLWFTDADIAHAPDNLRRLVARAEDGGHALVSLMAKLNCESLAERILVPAFVFFFQMLYPFAWVNDPKRKTAAAAGGCMLAKRAALEKAGHIDAIRHEIIDDCALARRMKAQGPIWLGLTDRAVSLRAYPKFGDIRRMVARSAYAQLQYSPLLLIGTLLGMIVTYGVPFFVAFIDLHLAGVLAAAADLLLIGAYQPMLNFYKRSSIWALALPLVGMTYAVFTLDSAIQYGRGRGGLWKGRVQAISRA
jgi:hopene-associated glycosyltransferase HpnB